MTLAGAGIIAKANYVGRSYILGVVFIAKAQPLKWPFSVPISPVNDIKEPPKFSLMPLCRDNYFAIIKNNFLHLDSFEGLHIVPF